MSETATKTLGQTLDSLKTLIMQDQNPQGQALVVAPAKQKLPSSAAKKSSVAAPPPQPKKIRDCLVSQTQLTRLVEQTYTALRKFGETGDSFEDREALFQLALGEYTIDQVNRAFMLYVQMHTEIPTPAEIIGYIDPWKRRLCPKMYSKLVNLRRKRVEEGSIYPLDDEQEEFIYRYEQQQLGDYDGR